MGLKKKAVKKLSKKTSDTDEKVNFFSKAFKQLRDLNRTQKIVVGSVGSIVVLLLLFWVGSKIYENHSLNQAGNIKHEKVNRQPEIYPNKINDVKQISPSELLNYQARAISQGYAQNYSGYVSIPDIEMNLPILNGVNMYTLSLGATAYYPTTRKMGENGNFVLAGHNMDTSKNVLFSRLPNVSIGKEHLIILTDGFKKYYYHITSKTVVSPNQKVVKGTSEPARDSILFNDTSKNVVTLFTCNSNGSRRIVVQGLFDHES